MQNCFDLALGKKIRELRRSQGFSLADVAVEIGVSYQQLQKYEAGSNSLSVSRLVEVARLYGKDPCEVFKQAVCEEMHSTGATGLEALARPHPSGEKSRLRSAYFALPLEKRMAFLRLMEAAALV